MNEDVVGVSGKSVHVNRGNQSFRLPVMQARRRAMRRSLRICLKAAPIQMWHFKCPTSQMDFPALQDLVVCYIWVKMFWVMPMLRQCRVSQSVGSIS